MDGRVAPHTRRSVASPAAADALASFPKSHHPTPGMGDVVAPASGAECAVQRLRPGRPSVLAVARHRRCHFATRPRTRRASTSICDDDADNPPVHTSNARGLFRDPRQFVSELEASPELRSGRSERVGGYGVMGLPFQSGHLLAMRRCPASSVPGYSFGLTPQPIRTVDLLSRRRAQRHLHSLLRCRRR